MMGSLIQVSKLLCIGLILFSSLASCSKLPPKAEEKVRQICSVTRYVDLCIRSLASYSISVSRSNYTAWARAAVSVALSEIKSTTQYLDKMNTSRSIQGRMNRQAVSDCVECFHDANDSLHQSLGVLRELDKLAFDQQMDDVMTWVSAALTEEDTCLDGLDEEAGAGKEGKRQRAVMERVRNCTYVTSNTAGAGGGGGGRPPPPRPENRSGMDVVFGQVVEGMDVVRAIEKVGSGSGKTAKPVVTADCGQLS